MAISEALVHDKGFTNMCLKPYQPVVKQCSVLPPGNAETSLDVHGRLGALSPRDSWYLDRWPTK